MNHGCPCRLNGITELGLWSVEFFTVTKMVKHQNERHQSWRKPDETKINLQTYHKKMKDTKHILVTISDVQSKLDSKFFWVQLILPIIGSLLMIRILPCAKWFALAVQSVKKNWKNIKNGFAATGASIFLIGCVLIGVFFVSGAVFQIEAYFLAFWLALRGAPINCLQFQ